MKQRDGHSRLPSFLGHPGLAENIAPDGGPGSDVTVEGFILVTIARWKMHKGVTNQQGSIVGVVFDSLDRHWVQYSLVT